MRLNLNNLRLIRISKGYSQEYVSDSLGISQATYSRIESGDKVIDLETLASLIYLLQVSPLELLTLSDYFKRKMIEIV